MYELRAQSATGEFDLMMHGTIGEWDKVNATDFSRAINAALGQGAKQINLKIHSPGGNPFEGIAIGTKIMEARSRNTKVIAVIEGMAASMMSAVSTFCDKVIIAKHARMMVHQSKGLAIGSAAQIIGYGNMMQTMNDTLAELYAGKTGKDKKWVMDNWMAEGKDKWFNHEEAFSAKLADEVSGDSKVKALAAEGGSYFEMAAHYDQFFTDTNETMDKKQLIALLGLKADATDAEIEAAIKSNKTKAEAAPPSAGGANNSETKKEPVVAAIVALAKERGADEATIKAIETVAAVNAEAAVVMIPKAVAGAGKEKEKVEPEKPLSMNDLIAALGKGTHAGGENPDRKSWSYNDWQKKDSNGLLAMAKEKPADFAALFEKQHGYKPSEDEIKKLVS